MFATNKHNLFSFKYIKEHASENDNNEFKGALQTDPILACNIYVRHLKKFYMTDKHLIPQNLMYRHNGERIIEFDYFARIENLDVKYLNKIMGVEFPHTVVSGNSECMYKQYLNRESYDILNVIYKTDFDELGYAME